MAITEVGATGEVQVMQGAEDAAEQEDNRLQNDGAVRSRCPDQAKSRKQQGNHGGGKHLEESLDP